MPDFNVGDKVRVIVQDHDYMFPSGTEGVIISVGPYNNLKVQSEAKADYWFYLPEQLERINEE